MDDVTVTEVAMSAMVLAAKLAGPVLLTTLGLGLGIGLLQSVTQVQEPTVAFVPKFVGVALVLLVGGGWMLNEAVAFTQGLFDMIPRLLA